MEKTVSETEQYEVIKTVCRWYYEKIVMTEPKECKAFSCNFAAKGIREAVIEKDFSVILDTTTDLERGINKQSSFGTQNTIQYR